MNLRQREMFSEMDVHWWEANRTVWCEMEGGECVTALGRQNPTSFSSCYPTQSGVILTKRKKIEQGRVFSLLPPFFRLTLSPSWSDHPSPLKTFFDRTPPGSRNRKGSNITNRSVPLPAMHWQYECFQFPSSCILFLKNSFTRKGKIWIFLFLIPETLISKKIL